MRAWRLTLKLQSVRTRRSKLLALYMPLIHPGIHSTNQREAFTFALMSNLLCFSLSLLQQKHKQKSPRSEVRSFLSVTSFILTLFLLLLMSVKVKVKGHTNIIPNFRQPLLVKAKGKKKKIWGFPSAMSEMQFCLRSDDLWNVSLKATVWL